MLPTIIFFLVLLLSIWFIMYCIEVIVNYTLHKQNPGYITFLLSIVVSILWSYLFYLLH